MILNTGMRTDIPAFFSEWFMNRLKEGYVLVRNPYNESAVTRYSLTPDVVDCICFCTKNPAPMLPRLGELDAFRTLWHVTLTPYDKDIEPNVPEKTKVASSIISLSKKVGKDKVFWRCDPIFITEKYSLDFHISAFEKNAAILSAHVNSCIISFIDLYQKTRKNFAEVREVKEEEKDIIGKEFSAIGKKYNIPIRTCCEGTALEKYGIASAGCMTQDVMEAALGIKLNIPKSFSRARKECSCILNSDIGMYNTCMHGCLYCYANYDNSLVERNFRKHDKDSPFLIGGSLPGDVVRDAKQASFLDTQLGLF